jgi:hypothetical protein
MLYTKLYFLEKIYVLWTFIYMEQKVTPTRSTTKYISGFWGITPFLILSVPFIVAGCIIFATGYLGAKTFMKANG